jgi:hypothetical protein
MTLKKANQLNNGDQQPFKKTGRNPKSLRVGNNEYIDYYFYV